MEKWDVSQYYGFWAFVFSIGSVNPIVISKVRELLKGLSSPSSGIPSPNNPFVFPSNAKSNWQNTLSESFPNSEKCEFKVINYTSHCIVLCWVDFNGKLHHYRRVNDSTIRDSSVNNSHTECTTAGHAFIILKHKERAALPGSVAEARPEDVICVYKLTQSRQRHTLHISLNQTGYHVKTSIETIDCMELMQPLSDSASKIYDDSLILGFHICAETGIFPKRTDVWTTLIHDLQEVMICIYHYWSILKRGYFY